MDYENIRIDLLASKSEEDLIELLNRISDSIPIRSTVDFTKEDIEKFQKSKGSYYHCFFDRTKPKERKITAPNDKLKRIQTCIKIALESIYTPPSWVHGYVFGRNVKSNAEAHQNKQYLLTLDFKEYYPNISTVRIQKTLTSENFGIKPKVAALITSLCCYRDQLTTGSPCSPIISNMVCLTLDNKLYNYCSSRKINYTRFADDLPFSSDQLPGRFIWNIKRIIRQEGFFLNNKKEKLQKLSSGQFVTNIFISGKRLKTRLKYRQEVRAMLHNWRNRGLEYCQTKFIRHTRASKKKEPDFTNSLFGKIQYIGQIHGKESAVYKLFLSQFKFLKKNKF